jgi:PAS domain S-box-containing protein
MRRRGHLVMAEGHTPRQSPDGSSRRPSDHSRTRPASAHAGTLLEPLFDSLPATIWMTDTKLALTFVQGTLLRRLDLQPERLLGQTLPDLLLDGREDHPFIQGHLSALAGHETSVRIEWGGTLYNARIAPLFDAERRVVGCAGVQQQIGWLPDDEGLLRERDIRLQRVIDSNMIGIAFGNDQGQITQANEAFLQLAGYTREDLVADGISWPAMTPVEFHQRQVRAIEEIRQTGRCSPFEFDLIRKDGTRLPVLVGAARLSARRREGVAFVLDVSERRQLRQRLAAELSAADALLDAETPQSGAVQALQILCDTFRWQTALLVDCRAADAPVVRLQAGAQATGPTVAGLACRAAASGSPSVAADLQAVALPLPHPDGSCWVLVLVGHPDGPVGAETLDACRAVGARIAKFLSRTGGLGPDAR